MLSVLATAVSAGYTPYGAMALLSKVLLELPLRDVRQFQLSLSLSSFSSDGELVLLRERKVQ